MKLNVKALREETPTSSRVKMREVVNPRLAPVGMARDSSFGHPEHGPLAVAVRLEACRIAFGLTQTEFCRKAGIALNTYGNYKNVKRKSRPDMDEMLSLCEAFPKIPLDWIYRGKDEKLDWDVRELILAAMDAAMVSVYGEKRKAS